MHTDRPGNGVATQDFEPQVLPEGLSDQTTVQPAAGQDPLAPTLDSPAQLCSPVSSPKAASLQSADVAPRQFSPGQRIGDFEILRVLGAGAFGVVYLARQLSLDRQVALKVSDSQGDEGRNMASLEHENIVQVFSETLDESGFRRLLCMQYVPGPTLDVVLRELRQQDPGQWSGALFIEIVDRLTPQSSLFDPQALRDRELLRQSDWVETVCWIGARLAEALAYAHKQGVIHRDVKPANVLVTQYGRPMLADFNLAARPLRLSSGASELFGGTLAYMSPEHLDAFASGEAAGRQAVAELSDLYALGVVLYEMLAGEPPYRAPPRDADPRQALRAMAAQRRISVPPLPERYPRVLDQTIRRCLDSDPGGRWPSGTELSAALEGCREFHGAAKAMPPLGRVGRRAARHPFRWLILLGISPHLVATVVNISYNQVRIISHLTDRQQLTFIQLVLFYDTAAYGIGIALALLAVVPVYRAWTTKTRLEAARARALALPLWAAALACLGWLPGAIVFPVFLGALSGPVPWHVYVHFPISFTISGLIALAYSALLVEWLGVCFFYPRLWLDARDFRRTAAMELQPVAWRLRVFQVLCGLIPLVGAILMVGVGPQKFTENEYRSFRLLVTAPIALGMIGFHLAMRATRLLSRAVTALGGSREAT